MWFSLKPMYSVTGAIRIAPVSSDILAEEEEHGAISDYERFKNTEVEMVTTKSVVQKVADALVDRKLSFFQPEPHSLLARLFGASREKVRDDPAAVLNQAIVADRSIMVTADHRSELIKITMQDKEPGEAKMIVDAFITTYMDVSAGRIQDLELQAEHPARISVAYYAKIAAIRDNRVKYTIGMVVGVIACCVVLVTLGKANRRSSISASSMSRI
jgi:uncharacterized protein involved in exopolysaccharide biosynthesis